MFFYFCNHPSLMRTKDRLWADSRRTGRMCARPGLMSLVENKVLGAPPTHERHFHTRGSDFKAGWSKTYKNKGKEKGVVLVERQVLLVFAQQTLNIIRSKGLRHAAKWGRGCKITTGFIIRHWAFPADKGSTFSSIFSTFWWFRQHPPLPANNYQCELRAEESKELEEQSTLKAEQRKACQQLWGLESGSAVFSIIPHEETQASRPHLQRLVLDPHFPPFFSRVRKTGADFYSFGVAPVYCIPSADHLTGQGEGFWEP